MGREALTNEASLRVGVREGIRIRSNPVPQRADVANLLVWAQVIETGRRIRNRLRHSRRIALATADANDASGERTASQEE
jgi:hypothetical protein